MFCQGLPRTYNPTFTFHCRNRRTKKRASVQSSPAHPLPRHPGLNNSKDYSCFYDQNKKTQVPSDHFYKQDLTVICNKRKFLSMMNLIDAHELSCTADTHHLHCPFLVSFSFGKHEASLPFLPYTTLINVCSTVYQTQQNTPGNKAALN